MQGRLIPYCMASGKQNMATDEALFNKATSSKTFTPTLRLYGWQPVCLSIGRRQKMADVDLQRCKQLGIDVVKRFGGGSAVYHEQELTYCFAASLSSGLDLSAASWRTIFVAVLKELCLSADEQASSGCNVLPTCFSSSAVDEPTINGKKWVGSARRKSSTAFLQHGSILLRRQPEVLQKLIIGYGAAEPIEDSSIGLQELDETITVERLSSALAAAVAGQFLIKW